MKGKIAEIFQSVQGEGIYFGEKQLFVRLYGCNLGCKFCDTKLTSFMEYEPQEVVEELKLYPDIYQMVSFTGGEPLLQKDFLKEVLILTRGHGFKNYLETNGTLPQALAEVIDYLDIVAMDIKLPSSIGGGNLWDSHCRFLKIAGQKELFVKMIICRSSSEEDFRQGLKLVKEAPATPILVLQPNTYERNQALEDKLWHFQDIATYDKVTACVIPQMHRVVGIE